MKDEEHRDSLSLLGRSESMLPSEPDAKILETFTNRSPHRNYWIHLDCPEFGSLCPVTGQPDTAHIQIRYIPSTICIETKSLKFYLASFRNQAAFNEEIVNRIVDDIQQACSPKQCVVRGAFAPRGGIRLTAEARFPDLNEELRIE